MATHPFFEYRRTADSDSAAMAIRGVARGGRSARSLVCLAPFRRALHVLDVLVKRAALRLVWRARPAAPPLRDFRVRHLEVDRARLAVDGDAVAVAGEGDRA